MSAIVAHSAAKEEGIPGRVSEGVRVCVTVRARARVTLRVRAFVI